MTETRHDERTMYTGPVRHRKSSKLRVGILLRVVFSLAAITIPSERAYADPEILTFGAGHVVGFTQLPDQPAIVADALQVGVSMTREGFPWYLMQPTGTGPINFTNQDRFVDNASDAGFRILGVLGYSPRPHSTNPEAENYFAYPSTTTPTLEAWETFVQQTVSHFKDRVNRWQIWTSCDARAHWAFEPGSPDNGAAKYLALLNRAHTAIKTEDPTATVVLCSADPPFLDALIDENANICPPFDAIGIHNFAEPFAPEVSPMLDLRYAAINDLRNRRCPDREVWITEYGYPTALNDPLSVDGPTQAAYNIRSFLLQNAAGAAAVIQTNTQDQATGGGYQPDDQLDNYGMILKYGSPTGTGETYSSLHKPGWNAYRSMTTALSEANLVHAGRLKPDSVEIFDDFEDDPIYLLTTAGGATGSLSLDSSTAHSGSTSGRIDYSLDPTQVNSAVAIYRHPSTDRLIEGTPSRISIWAKGDGGPAPNLTIRFTDTTGEGFSAVLGLVNDTAWQEYTFYFDHPPGSGASLLVPSAGTGNSDGIIDFPITFRSLAIRAWKRASPVTNGSVYVDDISFESGTTTFRYVYSAPSSIVYALWTLGPVVSVAVPTSAASAMSYDWQFNQNMIAASNGAVTVSVDSHPIFLSMPKVEETTGLYRPSNSLVFLKSENTVGFPPDARFAYGITGDLPVTGDWDGDGIDTIGIYRNGQFYLRNSNTSGLADIIFPFGVNGDLPVAGDWDYDGIDTIGIYRNGRFLLRNSNSAGPPDMNFRAGIAGDQPLAGDWNGDGFDSTGLFRPTNGLIFLKNDNSTGIPDVRIVLGLPNDKPIAGDWDGDLIDTIGVHRGAKFLLRNSNTSGFADVVFGFGIGTDIPIVGKWGSLP